jgi:uncharacterized protein YbjT (DUF2867 family)
MEQRIATVLGATGLIGSQLVELLQEDKYFTNVRVVVRREVSFNNPAIDVRVIDFADYSSFKKSIEGSDSLFCAVGTTQKKVKGDRFMYRKVDYDIPVHAAQFCLKAGCQHFLLVSSVGANSKSNNFYLKLKGEVEDELRKINLRSISIFRPSMLLGERNEFRAGELLGKALAVPFSFLFPENYKPVPGINVAKAMIAAAMLNIPGFHVYHYKEILQLIK